MAAIAIRRIETEMGDLQIKGETEMEFDPQFWFDLAKGLLGLGGTKGGGGGSGGGSGSGGGKMKLHAYGDANVHP